MLHAELGEGIPRARCRRRSKHHDWLVRQVRTDLGPVLVGIGAETALPIWNVSRKREEHFLLRQVESRSLASIGQHNPIEPDRQGRYFGYAIFGAQRLFAFSDHA